MAPPEAVYGRVSRSDIASFAFDEARYLASQERRHREPALRGQCARLAERVFVKGKRDVSSC
jgi:hypothetical protein